MTEHSPDPADPSVLSPTLPLPPPREEASRFHAEGAVGAEVERPPHHVAVTRDDIARNNLRLKALPASLRNLEAFLPQLQSKKPADVLGILRDRFAADPSPANASLLQHAVNRITTCGPVDAQLKRDIAKAVEVLHKPTKTKPTRTKPGATDDLFCWAYVDADFGGASMFLDLVPSSRMQPLLGGTRIMR